MPFCFLSLPRPARPPCHAPKGADAYIGSSGLAPHPLQKTVIAKPVRTLAVAIRILLYHTPCHALKGANTYIGSYGLAPHPLQKTVIAKPVRTLAVAIRILLYRTSCYASVGADAPVAVPKISALPCGGRL